MLNATEMYATACTFKNINNLRKLYDESFMKIKNSLHTILELY